MAGHSAQVALACQDSGRTHAGQTYMLFIRARCQGTLNPGHEHRARRSHLASHRSPAQRPQDYNLTHSRRLCANKHALCVTPNAQRRRIIRVFSIKN